MGTRPPEVRPDALGVIAATKLRAPPVRGQFVPRDALVAVVAGAPHTRLTLVSAPAGSGKTTLLALWRAAPFEQRPFAWLSLDRSDDDPARFWACVIEALRTVAPRVGAGAEGALRSPRAGLEDVVIPLLVNELATWEDQVVLVLDDLHEVRDPRIHASLAMFVDRLPPTVHVAVATRADPALPLARLRVRDELVELRAGHLRFDEHEARELLNGGLGLGLAASDVATLQRRTEGWAAGLQLAGLSLRGRRLAGEPAAVPAADDRLVVDYLVTEVLEGVDPALRRFLERTSILERLTAELCAAVTGEGVDACAERLAELDRRNLFTTALDAQGRWYRTHPLLSEALARHLEAADQSATLELHRRASRWWAAHGAWPEAVAHALAAGDGEWTAELVAAGWRPVFNRGWLTTVAGWLRALPEDRVERDPQLWLARAWTALDVGALDAVQPWLENAAGGEDERAAWAGVLLALRRFKSGDVPGARRDLERAQGRPEAGAFWRTVEVLVDGVTGFWALGPGDASVEAFTEARRLALADDNVLGAHYAVGYLALASAERGDRDVAAALLDEAEALVAREPPVAEHFTAMAAALARGRLAELTGDGALAAEQLGRAVDLARRGAGRPELDAARGAQARVEATGRQAASDGALAPATVTPPARAPRAPLSEGELRVLRLLPSALSLREIGGELFVSHNTVKTHTRSIYAKLRVTGREEAVHRANELHLL